MKPTISFVIPTYNNATTIGDVIRQCAVAGRKMAGSFEIVVINDGSSDGTARILQKLESRIKNLRVITHAKNLGYGLTIKELYYAARKDWIFSVPGDHQIRPGELGKLLSYRTVADIIIGIRTNRQDPVSRLIQSAVYNGLLRILFGLPVSDVNSVRFMRRAVIKKVKLFSSSAFVDAELAIKARDFGFSIKEVPISHQKQAGRGSGGSLATIAPTIVDMIRLKLAL